MSRRGTRRVSATLRERPRYACHRAPRRTRPGTGEVLAGSGPRYDSESTGNQLLVPGRFVFGFRAFRTIVDYRISRVRSLIQPWRAQTRTARSKASDITGFAM
jgi:hypothetical protein